LSKALAQGKTARLVQPGLLVFSQVYVARGALSNIYLNLINYLYETKKYFSDEEYVLRAFQVPAL